MENSDLFEALPFIVGAIPVAIILITVFVKLFGFIRNLLSDEVQYEATVLKKQRAEEYRKNRISENISVPYRIDIYFVTFKTPKHKKLKLKVDAATFRAAKEGGRGILTLQGKKFIGFEGSM